MVALASQLYSTFRPAEGRSSAAGLGQMLQAKFTLIKEITWGGGSREKGYGEGGSVYITVAVSKQDFYAGELKLLRFAKRYFKLSTCFSKNM